MAMPLTLKILNIKMSTTYIHPGLVPYSTSRKMKQG